MTPTKTCINCGKQFGPTKLRTGRLESPSQFARRAVCGRKCSQNKWRNFVI